MDTSNYGEIDKQIDQLMQCKPLSESEIVKLCSQVKEILDHEANIT